MSERIRAALQQLTELEGHTLVDCTADWAEAMIEARAALAESVGEGVTDEELLDIAAQSIEPYEKIRPGEYEAENNCAIEVYSSELVSFARAVLSRFGHQPAPPDAVAPGPSMEDVGPLIAWLTEQAHQAADASQPTDAGMLTWAAQVIGERVDEGAPAPPAAGEVGELLQFLRDFGDELMNEHGGVAEHNLLTRAADLLSLHHPTPVPAPERLPGPEDCDGEGRCWVGYPELTYSIADTGDTDTTTPEWRLEHQPLKPKGSRFWWLPAHALPLPQGEVE